MPQRTSLALRMRANFIARTLPRLLRLEYTNGPLSVYNTLMDSNDKKPTEEPNAEAASSNDVTLLLDKAANGDKLAANDLLPLVYQQLRAIAQLRMTGENAGHTLQATALVHEVFLRLVGDRKIPWQNQAHFYAAAAEAMRRVLLDHAKSKGRKKRGGDRKKMPLNVADLATEQNPEQIMALDAALCRLEEQNPEAAQVVRLRFYAGLSVDQTAEALDMSPRTVDRRWKFARAWLFKALGE